MMEETKFPTTSPRRRSSLKRQRLAVLISLGVVLVLAVTFALVWRFTSRITVEYPNGDNVTDTDGTKYYSVKKDDTWVMINEHGDVCETTADKLFKTKDGTLVMIDQDDGKPTVVATVLLHGTETTMLNANDGSYDILLYPMLERKDIQSIRVHNVEKDKHGQIVKVNDFTMENQSNGSFLLKGHPNASVGDVMLSTLVVLTGYTRTIARLDLSPENPDAEGFRQNGYAEYGLPENPADAENYFVITAKDGTSHKVIIGNIISDDTGYYARYADREDVYVLSQMQESEFNSTLSGTLLCAKEDYVTPTITATLGETYYFDVTDFTIYKTDASAGNTNISTYEQVVQFSYSPIELRANTYEASMPYKGQGKIEGYAVNDTRADICLSSLLEMSPSKTVKLYEDDGDTGSNLNDFVTQYGVGFAISFVLNRERDKNSNYEPQVKIDHHIWISPMTKTEDGVEGYYMFNETYDMVVMMERRFVEFLEWNDYKWVESGIFEANIIYLKELHVTFNQGTSFGANEENAGLPGVTNASFSVAYLDKNGNAANSNSGGEIKVMSSYIQNGIRYPGEGSDLFTDTEEKTAKFKEFFLTLYASELSDAMPTGSESLQEQLKASEPDLEIKTLYDLGGGKTEEKVYRFYFRTANSGRGCYVTINGKGSFYMQQNRVEKIINDLGRLLEPSATIDHMAKT